MSELKPCPFCGGVASLDITRRYNGPCGCDLYVWRVKCEKCGSATNEYDDEAIRDSKGLRLLKDGRQRAIAQWNMRVGE